MYKIFQTADIPNVICFSLSLASKYSYGQENSISLNFRQIQVWFSKLNEDATATDLLLLLEGFPGNLPLKSCPGTEIELNYI